MDCYSDEGEMKLIEGWRNVYCNSIVSPMDYGIDIFYLNMIMYKNKEIYSK